MPADVDERFLIEECLLGVTHHTLGRCFNAETDLRLNQLTAWGHFSSLHHLVEVLIVLFSVLGVRDFINVLAHNGLEFVVLHGFGEVVHFLLVHVQLLTLNQRMVHLLVLFNFLRV